MTEPKLSKHEILCKISDAEFLGQTMELGDTSEDYTILVEFLP